MSEPVKIAIVIEGGCVQSVLTAGVAVECVVIDYDTDGRGEGETTPVPQGNGDTEAAYVGWTEVEDSPEGRALTAWAFAATEEEG